ncbi:MAG: heparinase II/III family protein [Candidatus Sericytochromatia bacterium]|nr:heparinase II/III family protein [Candidatus Sericytochromatia bacterium]
MTVTHRIAHTIAACLTSLALIGPGELSAEAQAAPLPPHPRLLFDARDLPALRERVHGSASAPLWDKTLAELKRSMAEPVTLPPRGGNWSHFYVCPKHGVRLETGKELAPWHWEHRCPVDGEILASDPAKPPTDLDGVVIGHRHYAHARSIRNAGIAYQLTGEPAYARFARTLLLAYKDAYRRYPFHEYVPGSRFGGGHAQSTILDEAVWLIPVAQGADLVWDTLSAQERRDLAEQVFLPAVRECLLPYPLGVHNIQCWKNSAIGLVGYLLGDQSLIGVALDDPQQGFRQQLRQGVQDDGVWFEGAWGYQFYMLNALAPLTEAARHAGTNLYDEPLHRLFTAPLRFAMPNLRLPAFNDSEEVSAQNPLYELAYARYKDPLFAAGIPSDRMSEPALWYGLPQVPSAVAPASGSRNASTSGYAILQKGQGSDATWLCLKYGPHGGGHGHPDKNGFVLYSRGRVVCPDAGIQPYGSPMHGEWNRTTVAHNTLAVDEQDQARATGTCLAFGSTGGVDYAMTDAGAIAPGVRFVRTAFLLDHDLVVFADQMESQQPHTWDIVCHAFGQWAMTATAPPWQGPGRHGYQHLKDTVVRPAAQGVTLPLRLAPDWTASLIVAPGGLAQVITGTGMTNRVMDRVPAALLRQTGPKATVVWALDLAGGTSTTLSQTVTPSALTVEVRAGQRHWQLTVDPQHARVAVKAETTRSK